MLVGMRKEGPFFIPPATKHLVFAGVTAAAWLSLCLSGAGSTGSFTDIFSPLSSSPCCVCSETLPVEYMGGKPLCMNQYYQILSSCRIPGPKRDSIVNYAKGKKQSRHITVVHNFQVRQLLSFLRGLFRCRWPFQLQKVSAHKVSLTRNSLLLLLSPLALAGQ